MMINAGKIDIGTESISTTWNFENFGSTYIDGQFVTRSTTLRTGSVTCGTGILWYLAGHLIIEPGANICDSLKLQPYGLENDFRVKCSGLRNAFPSKGLGVDNGTRSAGFSPAYNSALNVIR